MIMFTAALFKNQSIPKDTVLAPARKSAASVCVRAHGKTSVRLTPLALSPSVSLDLHCLRLKPKLNCGRRPQINPGREEVKKEEREREGEHHTALSLSTAWQKRELDQTCLGKQ